MGTGKEEEVAAASAVAAAAGIANVGAVAAGQDDQALADLHDPRPAQISLTFCVVSYRRKILNDSTSSASWE